MNFPDGISDSEKLALALRRIKMYEEDQDMLSEIADEYEHVLSTLRVAFGGMVKSFDLLMNFAPKR